MIEQTTLHNILTWIIAVILFIFQSLNYFLAKIKKYVKHGEKTTTIVTADTTISPESNPNNNNALENVITVQRLIRKHFDIPLIIAEDEPKVNNFIKSAQLLTSNESCKEKKKTDQFMDNLVDDSYVARGLGLITATVGRQSEFYLYSKYDNNFENVVIKLKGRNGELGQITILNQNPANIIEAKSIPMDYFYDKDRIKVTYTPFAEGVYTLTLVRNNLSICRSPYYISVEKSTTNSRSQIRLGTKKYKPVTKFVKAKHAPLETCDNSIPNIEPSKPPICRNILPEPEENATRTDVMSIVTKFESNSINVQKRVLKRTSSISEKGPETDLIDEISTYSNIQPKIENDIDYITNASDLNSPSIHPKSKSPEKKCRNDVDIAFRNSKACDLNAIDDESGRINKPMTKLNESIEITNDIPSVKNILSTQLKPTNSVLVESLNDGNSHYVEKHDQNIKITKLTEENNHIETFLDSTTIVDESKIKFIDNDPFIQNEVSCFDDDDRKTVVVMENTNDVESNLNDTVIQQITESGQYNINTPFASIITKITNSICEKCSIQVLKILSEFPRDINITHKNNSNEIRSSFETLLAQPISININIDNLFEHPISATNDHKGEHLLTNSPTNIKHMDTTEKDIKWESLNEIDPLDTSSNGLYSDINNITTELMIKQNKHNKEISKTKKDKTINNFTMPFREHIIDKHKTLHLENELSTNETIKIKYSTTNEDNELHSNQSNNNIIHKSDKEMKIQVQNVQKSLEHNIKSTKTNQAHENINKELNSTSKESLDASYLETINYDQNANEELVTDEFINKNVIIPDKNTKSQSSCISNTVLPTMEVTLATSEHKSEDNEQQTNNKCYKNVILTSIQDENQKLIIEKSIEPILNNFKNKIVENITQLYLNKDLSNIDYNSIFENRDRNLTDSSKKIQINNKANNTDINTKYIETLTSQLKNHIDKNDVSDIRLNKIKTENNHLFKYVENIIKTNINSSEMYAQTLEEKKLQTLVNIAMNHPTDRKMDNEFQKIIIGNETQDVSLKQINNGEKLQNKELTEVSSVTQIQNTNELTSSKNEVKGQCKIPLINYFDTIEIENTNADIKKEMKTFNINNNVTNVETNEVEIKALRNFHKLHNIEINTPIIEPTLETQIMNTSELLTVEEHNSGEMASIETIESNIIPEKTDVVIIENMDESVKLHINENVIIKIPHMVDKDIINEAVENINIKKTTKSNSTENKSIHETKKQEIESPDLKKLYDANVVTIEKETIQKLSPFNKTEDIIIEKPNSQGIITTINGKVSKNVAKVTIGINRSDAQFLNSTITVLIPLKIPMVENSSMEIKNTSQSTSFNNAKQLFMKNNNLEKTENIDEIFTNKSEQIISVPPFANDTSNTNIMEITKKEKDIIDKTMKSKYSLTTLEPTVNEMNRNITNNDTAIPINSLIGDVVERTIDNHEENKNSPIINPPREPEIKLDETLVGTETQTSAFIDPSTASLLRTIIIVQFVTEKNETPIESLAIITNEHMTEDDVTARETTSTMNSLEVVIEEKVNMKNCRSVNASDKCINTETKTPKSIDQKHAEKMTEKEHPEPISSNEPKKNKEDITKNKIISGFHSSNATKDDKIHAKNIIEEAPINSLGEFGWENMTVDIDKENETRLPIDTSTGIMEKSKVIEETIETLFPIEKNIRSIEKPKVKVEEITKFQIKSCTNSSTVIIDAQKDIENIIVAPPSSPNEIMEEKKNITIGTGSETLLRIDTFTDSVEQMKKTDKFSILIESTMESIENPNYIQDIIETGITSCTKSSNKIINNLHHAEKIVDKDSMVTINSLNEVEGVKIKEHIGNENETLLQNETSTSNVEAIKEIDPLKTMVNVLPIASNIDIENKILLAIKSTIGSLKGPKLVEDKTKIEITSCIDCSSVIEEDHINAEKAIEEAPLRPMHLLVKDVGDKFEVNIKTEKETLLPIDNSISSVRKKEIDGTTEIISYTDSSSVNIKERIEEEKVIEEESQKTIIDLVEEVGEEMRVKIETEKETLLQIDNFKTSVDKKKKIDDTIHTENESLLPIDTSTSSAGKMKEIEETNEKILFTDSSSDIVEDHIDVEEVIREESPKPITDLVEEVGEKMIVHFDTANQTLLQIDTTASVEEMKEKDETNKTEDETLFPIDTSISSVDKIKEIEGTTEMILNNDPSAVNEDHNDVEKVSEEESPKTIIDLVEEDGEKMRANIDNEDDTLLPIDTSTNSTEEMKEIEETTEKILYTHTSSVIEEDHKDVENVIVEESPKLINDFVEEDGEKMRANIDNEDETLLPIDTSTNSAEEIKEKEETTEMILNTDPPTVNEDHNDVEKVIEEESPKTIIDSVEEDGEKMRAKIDNEDETLLPIDTSTNPTEEMNEIEETTEKILYTDPSTVNEDHNDVEEVIEEGSPKTITDLDEEDGEKMRAKIDNEDETLLPIDTSTNSTEEMKEIEETTEMILNTDPSTVNEDHNDVEEVIEEESPKTITDLVEEDGEKMRAKIDNEDETLLPIDTSTNSTEEMKETEETTEKILYTDPSTVNEDHNDVEEVIEEESPKTITDLDEEDGEKMRAKIDNEDETLLPIDTSTNSTEEMKEIEETTEMILNTDPSTVNEDHNDVEEVIEEESPKTITDLVEEDGEKMRAKIDNEDETLLPIDTSTNSTEEMKETEETTEKLLYTDPSTVNEDHNDVEKVIEEESPKTIIDLVEEDGEKMRAKIDNEDETLLPIDTSTNSTEKMKEIEETTEMILNTDPSTVNEDHNDVEEVIEEESPKTITDLVEEDGEKMRVKIDTEKETFLQIDNSITLMDEIKKIDETIYTKNESLLSIDTSTNSSEEIKEIEETTEIILNTDTSTVNEDHNDVEKVIEEESPKTIIDLVEEDGEKMRAKIDNEDETLLPIDTSTNPTKEMNEIEETTEMILNTDPSTVNEDHNDVEKVIEEESPKPIIDLVEEDGEKMRVKIDTEKETFLPIDTSTNSTEEMKETEETTEKILYTDPSTVNEDHNDVEKVIEEESPKTIIDLVEEDGEKMRAKIDNEDETLLPIDTSTNPTKEMNEIEETTEMILNTDPSTVNEDHNDVEKVIEEESPKTIIDLVEEDGEKMRAKIDNEDETLLPIDTSTNSTEEMKETEETTEKILYTDPSTVNEDHNDVEKVIEEESPKTIIDLVEEDGEKMRAKIDNEDETLLPIDTSTNSTEEMKEIEETTEMILNTDPSTVNEDHNDVEEVIEEESPKTITDLVEEDGEKMRAKIDNEDETLLPIDTSTNSTEEMKETEETTEKILYTDPSTVNEDHNDVEKVIEEESPKTIIDLVEEDGEKMRAKIDNEDETLLPIDTSTNSTEEMKEIEETTEMILNTDPSTVNEDHNDVEEVIEEESPKTITDLVEEDGEKMRAKIDNEDETLLPIDTSTNSTEEMKETEETTEKILYTDPSTVNEDHNDVEKVIEEESPKTIIDLVEEDGEKMRAKIDNEDETLLPIDTSTNPTKEMNEIEETTEMILNTDPSTVNEDHNDVEKVIEEESPKTIIDLVEEDGEKMRAKIDNEDETLLPIDTSTNSTEEMKEIEETTEMILNTDPSTVNEDHNDVEEVIEEESPKTITDLDEEDGEKMRAKIDNEDETLLPIDTSTNSTEEMKEIEETTEKILYTDPSTVNEDHNDVKKVIVEESPKLINDFVEEDGEKMRANIDNEDETLFPIDTSTNSAEEIKEKEETTEMILNTDPPTVNEDHNDVEKVIEEESPKPIIDLVEEDGEKMRVKIDTEKETFLPIDTSTNSTEEMKEIEETTEMILNTDPSTVNEDHNDVEEVIEEESPKTITDLVEEDGEKMRVKIDNEDETLLPIDASTSSGEQMKEIEETYEKIFFTNSSSDIVEDHIDVEEVIKEESPKPITDLVEEVGEKLNVNIDTKNEIVLPIDISIGCVEEKKKTDEIYEIVSDSYINIEKSIHDVPLVLMNSLGEVVKENKISIIDEENEILLPIDISSAKMKKIKIVEETIETLLPIKRTIECIEELKVVKGITETEITPSTDCLDLIPNSRTDIEEVNEEVSLLPINSLLMGEKRTVNIDTENKTSSLIDIVPIDVISVEEPKAIKTETTAMISSVVVTENAMKLNADAAVIETCKKSLDNTVEDMQDMRNETTTLIDNLDAVLKKQTDLEKVTENESLMLVDRVTAIVEKPIKIEKLLTEKENTTLIACKSASDVESNKIKTESENVTSTPVSASITKEQTEVENIAERTSPNDNSMNSNDKTVFIGTKIKTDNSDNPNNCYLKFGETSRMHRSENEDNNLQGKSYGIQKLEMSVQRMRTSNEDYYKKTFVQLEQTEKISKVDKDNDDIENKTIIDDKLYTVNESDLNAILCASSLEEALTLLDSKIKFKFKHRKSSCKINSAAYIPKMQKSDSRNSDVNTNFTDAREFFKEMEKKSKK